MPDEPARDQGSLRQEGSLHEVLEQYLAAIDAGKKPDPEELIARHPELAPELRAFLQGQEDMDRFGRQVAAGLPRPAAVPGGQEIHDHELVAEIARGGMGVVFKARQRSLNRFVALKMILAGRLATAEEVRRFHREAEAAAGLDHPNIVPIYEVGQHEGQPYYTMKLVEGGSLAELRHGFPDEPRRAARLIETVARAVHYAHLKGVIHRDLKPANILIDRDGNPLVTDFGLAKALAGEGDLTQTTAILGTPSYMAPEQAAGKKGKVTAAADVYSLGAVLYDLIAGRPPFRRDSSLETLRAALEEEAPSPHAFNPRVVRDLEAICLKCLEKDPRRRYASAGSLADDLQRFLAGRAIEARRVSLPGRGWRWCRRNPVIAALTASTAALLVAGTVGSWLAAAQLRDKLWLSYRAQARAGRVSGLAGQRLESLKALGEAARIRPDLELRNEAIQCFGLIDLELVKHVDATVGGETAAGAGFDATLERYAASDEKGNIQVRRLDDDRVTASLPGPGIPGKQFLFSPDGRFLAAYHWRSSNRWTLQIWDLERPSAPYLKEKMGVIGFGPGPRQAVIGRSDGSIALRDLSPGTEPRILRVRRGQGPTDFLGSILRGEGLKPRPGAISGFEWIEVAPEGQAIAACGRPDTRRVRVVDLESGAVRHELIHGAIVLGGAWHPQGVLLATCGGRTISIWEATSGKLKATLKGHDGTVSRLAFDPVDGHLASTSWDNTLRLWDPDGERLLVMGTGTYGAQYSPDGRLLGSRNTSSRLWLWRKVEAREARVLRDPMSRTAGQAQRGIETIEFSPDGLLLAASGPDGVSLWDAPAGKRLALLPAREVRSASFLARPGSLVAWGENGLLSWEIEPFTHRGEAEEARFGSPQPLCPRPASPSRQPSPPGRAVFSPEANGFAVITDYGRGEAAWIDLTTFEIRALLRGPPGLHFLAVSPRGKWAAGGTWKGTGVRVWELPSGEPARDLPVEGSAFVDFSPDGKWLVTSAGREHRSWEVGTWTSRWGIQRDNAGNLPGRTAFSRDGRLLAVTSSLSEIKILHPETGHELATLAGPDPQFVEWLCFNPSGSHLAAARAEDSIQLWDLALIRAQLSALGLGW